MDKPQRHEAKSFTDKSWEQALTLEAWMEKALSEGRDDEVIAVMKCIGEEKKERYREIWKRHRGKKS